MKLFILSICAVTALGISNGHAALTFDLNEPGQSHGQGYDTQEVTAANSFDADGVGSADDTGNAAVDRNDGGVGNLRFTASVAQGETAQAYADIDMTNLSTAGVYDTRLNEFYINYTITNNSDVLLDTPAVRVLWRAPGDTVFYNTGISDLDSSGRDHFQGEDVYLFSGQAVAPPLLANGQTGTLRLQFTSTNNSGFGGDRSIDYLVSNISFTAVVPEPSSALLLSGVLGLFGTCFRRRRKITA